MQNTTNHIKRELQLTADGSHTLFIPEMDEHYHSVNGAVQESRHVFIEAGLHHLERRVNHHLEIGFGTGLNAFLTLLDAEACQRKIHYCSIELYPLGTDVIESLNYGECSVPDERMFSMPCIRRNGMLQSRLRSSLNCIKYKETVIRVLCRIEST